MDALETLLGRSESNTSVVRTAHAIVNEAAKAESGGTQAGNDYVHLESLVRANRPAAVVAIDEINTHEFNPNMRASEVADIRSLSSSKPYAGYKDNNSLTAQRP